MNHVTTAGTTILTVEALAALLRWLFQLWAVVPSPDPAALQALALLLLSLVGSLAWLIRVLLHWRLQVHNIPIPPKTEMTNG